MEKLLFNWLLLIFFISFHISIAQITDGYTDKRSYRPGDTAIVFVNATSSQSNISLKVFSISNISVDTIVADSIFPQSIQNSEPWQNGLGYVPTFLYIIPPFKSGVYTFEKIIPFIIKSASDSSDITIVCSTNTSEAYNEAGGKSLYDGNSSNNQHALIVTFQRSISFYRFTHYFVSFLKWMDKTNYNYNVITDMDLDDYSAIQQSRLLIIAGHSEYWTRIARENFDKFVDEGKNAIVLSGNNMYWQVRYSQDKKQLICYRDASLDPIQDTLLKTILWYKPSLNYPILNSIGADLRFGGYGTTDSLGWDGYKIIVPQSPLFNGTNLQKGDIFSLPSNEYDGSPNLGLDSKGYPIIDTAQLHFYKFEYLGFDISTRPSNSEIGYPGMFVFQKSFTSGKIINTATTNWGDPRGIDNVDSSIIRKITKNMIDKLLNDENVFAYPTIGFVTQNVYCNGQNNGSAKLSIKYGISPFKILWSTGDTIFNIFNLKAGDYYVQITDSIHNTFSKKITITEPDSLKTSFKIVLPEINQNNGWISTTVTGGTSPYSYLWNTGDTGSILYNISSGQYYLSVIDFNGCKQNSYFNIQSKSYSGNLNNYIQIIPNPTSKTIFVKLSLPLNKDIEITTINSMGELIFHSHQKNDTGNNCAIDVSRFSSGLYIVTIKVDEKDLIKKIMVLN